MNEPRLGMRKVYLKDLSFECPNTPEIFAGAGAKDIRPVMKSNITKSHSAMKDDEYEVVLRVTVQALLEDESSLFLAEISQAGIFWVPDSSEQSLNRSLHVDCCRALFPFARETMWTVVSRGGLPPLLLQDINFEALYAQI